MTLCKDCRFFERIDGAPHGDGECRRNPPALVPKCDYPHYSSVWPVVRLTDWCGQAEERGIKQLRSDDDN